MTTPAINDVLLDDDGDLALVKDADAQGWVRLRYVTGRWSGEVTGWVSPDGHVNVSERVRALDSGFEAV